MWKISPSRFKGADIVSVIHKRKHKSNYNDPAWGKLTIRRGNGEYSWRNTTWCNLQAIAVSHFWKDVNCKKCLSKKGK